MPESSPALPPGVDVRIGISGWTYAPWRGTFFPRGVTQKQELAFASRQVSSIEINGTFYSLQRPSSFALWYEQTPPGFLFSVKAPRFITHMKRLKNIRLPLANFLASGVLRLNEKLGPLLWQLPPMQIYDRPKLQAFFDELPRSTAAAAAMGRRHDFHLRVRAWNKIDEDRPMRHALEVRHPSFQNPEFIELLRENNIALVVADTAGKWPFMEDITADFAYARLHGDEELYVSGYTPEALAVWEQKVRAWANGANSPQARLAAPNASMPAKPHDVYVYFDNDVKTRAPYDAMSLAHSLDLGSRPADAPPIESITETARTSWPGFSARAPQTGQTVASRKTNAGTRAGEKKRKPGKRSAVASQR